MSETKPLEKKKSKQKISREAYLKKLERDRERNYQKRKARLISKYHSGDKLTDMEIESVKQWLDWDNRKKWIPIKDRIF